MADDTSKDTTGDSTDKQPAEQSGATSITGTGAAPASANSGGGSDKDKTDAGAINDGSGQGKETPDAAAKDPKKDPSVAGPKLFPGVNTPANSVDPKGVSEIGYSAAIDTTPHKITGVDVTQPPALDLDSGLARTTLFEAQQDDKTASKDD